MPAYVVTRVIALPPHDTPATEWLESWPRRVWTRARGRAHEFPSRGEAETIAERLRDERTSPFFIFAKPSRPHAEPELPLPGELTFDDAEQRERVEQAQVTKAVEQERPRYDWHAHAPNCGVD